MLVEAKKNQETGALPVVEVELPEVELLEVALLVVKDI